MSRRVIQDEFTNLPISRQRKYQLRMQRDGRCSKCGKPVAQGSLCLEHLVQTRELKRKALNLHRRYLNTLSYKMQRAVGKSDRFNHRASETVARAE